MRGEGGGSGISSNEYSCMYTGAQINFGDLTPYLTHGQNPLSDPQKRKHGFRHFFTDKKLNEKICRFYLFLFVVREPISGIGEVGEFYVGLVALQRNIFQLFNP